MSKPRIVIFIVSMSAGGAERVVSNILKHLSNEFDFHLILLNKTIQYDLPKDVKIHFLDDENLDKPTLFDKLRSLVRMPLLAYSLKKYCQKHQIPLVFSLLSRPNYISSLLKMLQKDIRVIISQRSNVTSFYSSQSIIDKLNRFLTKQLYPMADLIVSNSKGIQNDLKENYGLDKATSTVYNPFDFKHIALQKEENIAFKGLDTEGGQYFNKFTFVSVGRLNAVKNHPLLLEAFARLNDKTTQLLIVGDEAQAIQDIPALACALGVEDRVIFTGFQSNPYKFMAKANCYVLSSDSEGFPNVLVEAIACGLPIIATDCQSGPRELLSPLSDSNQILNKSIEKADYGLLTPVGNVECLTEAMSLMRNDDSLSQHYIEKSQARLMDFQLDKILSDFRHIFFTNNSKPFSFKAVKEDAKSITDC